MEQSIQEWTKYILWKTAFKNLLSPLLNNSSHIRHINRVVVHFHSKMFTKCSFNESVFP